MIVSVIGNIGSGKSSLLKSLSNSYGCNVVYEPVNEWKFLSKFYADMNRWCFALQVEILNSFRNLKINNAIVERSPWEASNIFAKNLYNNKLMTEDEYMLIQSLTNDIGYKPDIFVYLRTDPDMCMSRIKNRNRECENSIEYEYISQLHELYEQAITTLTTEGRDVLIVDATMSIEEISKFVIENLNIIK